MNAQEKKKAIRPLLQGTKEEETYCDVCEANRVMIFNPKTDKVTCKTCKTAFNMPDSFYTSAYDSIVSGVNKINKSRR